MLSFLRSPARDLTAALVAAALLAAPHAADAQLGGLLKRAAEKAGEKAVDKATGAEDKVSPRVNGAELTDDALGRLLRGLAVTAEKFGQRDELQQQLSPRNEEINRLRERNEAAINSWNTARDNWTDCFQNQYGKIENARDGEMKVGILKLMGDPKKAQAYAQLTAKYSTEQQAAMTAGDTLKFAEVNAKLQREYFRMLGVDITADSAKARAACGTEPKKLAVMVQIEGLEARRDSLQVRVRDAESTAQTSGAKAAGMELAEFALQREKAVTFVGSGNGGGMLTRDELNRLRAKRAELEKVKKAL